MGTKSAAMTVNVCPSMPTCTQLLMPVLMSRRRCVFPGFKVVTAYLPPDADFMRPLIRKVSAVGGPLAWRAAALRVNL